MQDDDAERPDSRGRWEPVLTAPDYYDGVRRGTALFRGEPCVFESTFADFDGKEDVFELIPLDRKRLRLELEDWAIWRRWERAYAAGLTTMETHPALPQDQARAREVEAALETAREADEKRADERRPVFATAEFGPSGTDNGHASLVVRWTEISLDQG